MLVFICTLGVFCLYSIVTSDGMIFNPNVPYFIFIMSSLNKSSGLSWTLFSDWFRSLEQDWHINNTYFHLNSKCILMCTFTSTHASIFKTKALGHITVFIDVTRVLWLGTCPIPGWNKCFGSTSCSVYLIFIHDILLMNTIGSAST